MSKTICIIGRGHSGTRVISFTLKESGVFMGKSLNRYGDKAPYLKMWKAARLLGKYVLETGEYNWDFSSIHKMTPSPIFVKLVTSYLHDLTNNSSFYKGWKLPETTLIYPWLLKMFPDFYYIHWIRDPRDNILFHHITDYLNFWNIKKERTGNIYKDRAISWKYQWDIIKACPGPKHFIRIKFEDFVLKQNETLKKLEEFLDINLVRIPVKKDTVGRWKNKPEVHIFDFLKDGMKELNYI